MKTGDGDYFWAVVSFLAFVITLILSAANKAKKSSDTSIDKTHDANVAINTLVGLGYSEQESNILVIKAMKKKPNAKYEEIINIAIKHDW